MSTSRQVNQAIARFDEVMGRIDRGAPAREAAARQVSRGALGDRPQGRQHRHRLGGDPDRRDHRRAGAERHRPDRPVHRLQPDAARRAHLLDVAAASRPIVDYKEDMPNHAVVQRLGTLLDRKRAALPAPAARSIDAINQQLPLLESRLGETNQLDPLAQDARRLMGKHLPELIERYERVPAAYRSERDGEGLTVDQRLVQGLDAAKTALDDLGRRLAREDLNAFETQGRFIESRYKDGGETAPPQ